MASSVPASLDLAAIVTVAGGLYITHHCWAFDRFRCLLPSRKDWFRVLLTWMLVASDGLLCIWAMTFAVLKHKYGYINIPGVGYTSVPPDLFEPRDVTVVKVMNTFVTLALWLQVSLNAEEGLYWYHLMRAVRQPRSSKSWVNSSFFFAWIAISVLTLVANQGAIWIGIDSEIQRSARIYAVLGSIELCVAIAASIVIVQFPQFLEDVRRSGASREVRSRLYFYHEANKLRTFFRLLFAICSFTLGVDGLTEKKRVNMTRWAAESLEQMAYTSYFLAMVISVTLYLPRTYSSTLADGKVMIGNQVPRGGEDAASNALMSLLREGGQWDGTDAERAKGSAINLKADESDEWDKEADRNEALVNFISPIAVAPAKEEIPTEIRIHVQQEVIEHADGGWIHNHPGTSADLKVPKYRN